jgi:N-acetylneuraminic acid mutarotase
MPNTRLISALCALFFTLTTTFVSLGAGERWVTLAPLMAPRQEVGVAELTGQIYVVGGFNSAGMTVNTVEVYDTITNTWRPAAPLPRPLDHPAAVAVAGKVYVLGGFSPGIGATNGTFEYDSALNTWAAKAPMPTSRGALAVAVLDNKILAVGGARGSAVSDFAIYDPATDVWTQLPPMPTAREHLTAGAIGGKFYAISGRSGQGNLNAVEEYDPATNTWSRKTPIPTPRSGIAGAVANNRLYVFGGELRPGVFNNVESYDPATDTWATHTPMPVPRHGINAVAIGNKIFVPGGATVQGFGATSAHDAFLVQTETIYFPHFVTGQGIQSEITLLNPSTAATALGAVELFGPNGDPLLLRIDGVPRSNLSVIVPPLGSVTLRGDDAPSGLQVGWVIVSPDLVLNGTVLFSGAFGVAGVGAAEPFTRFIASARRDAAGQVRTGLAIANTANAPATVSLVLRNERGMPVDSATVTLPPRGQVARFLEELFTTADTSRFRGTITATSDAPVVATVLLVTANQLATLPIGRF